MTHNLDFKIATLQQENTNRLLESLVIFIAAFFVVALLPQLLVRYLYADAQLLEAPKALELIPVVSFAFASAYFVFAMITNFLRSLQMKKMQAEMEAACETYDMSCCNDSGDCGDCDNCGDCSNCDSCKSDDCDCNHGENNKMELEKLVTKVEKSSPKTAALSKAMKTSTRKNKSVRSTSKK